MASREGCQADLQVLEAYAKGLGEKKWKLIDNKLKEGESTWVGSC